MKSYPKFFDDYSYWENENGSYHREDGPAVEYNDGSYKAYYVNGHLHRLDGPALIWNWFSGI